MRRGGAAPVDRIGRFAHELQLELRLPAQLVDQAGHGVAAIAGAHEQRQADPVGLEFLLARVAPERQQTVARHRAADRDRSGHDRGLDGGIEHALAGAGALGGVALGEVAHLVAESGGKLGLVVEHGEKPAGDEDVARHGMSIGDRQIEHDETIAAAEARLADQLLADAVDIGLQRRVGIEGPTSRSISRGSTGTPLCTLAGWRGSAAVCGGLLCGVQAATPTSSAISGKIRRKTTNPPSRRDDLRRSAAAAAIAARLEQSSPLWQ